MCCTLCVFIVFIACVFGQTGPVVNTSIGQIVGLKDEFIKFLGIPYAVVDVNDPFGPAKPPLRFETPYHATRNPVICPQLVNGTLQGDIQCLNLNVYTPINTDQKKPLPVMVFIHGGRFKVGDGNFNTYSPVFLVKKDVIVVALNYRLGPYGFLCLEQDEYYNQGIKDQSLALKWVKNNIKNFGGDDNNILLFGHSAGSVSTEFHLLNNEHRVFNKVIMQGLQLASPLLSGKPMNYKYLTDLAARVGLDSKYVETKDIIRELSKFSMDLLVNVTYSDRFRPCINNYVIGEASFNQNLKDVKIIMGSASKEIILMYNNESNYANLIKRDLKIEFDNIENGVDRVENYYLKNNVRSDVIDFGCDFHFNYPLERSMRHVLRSNATIYRYLFSYDGGRNYIKYRDGIDAEGAIHGDELGYLFDADLFGDAISARDQSVIDTITTFWTNFAKFGDPTPSELSPVTLWPVLGKRSTYMDIGTIHLVKTGYRKDQMTFWDSFYEEFGALSNGLYYVDERGVLERGIRSLRLFLHQIWLLWEENIIYSFLYKD